MDEDHCPEDFFSHLKVDTTYGAPAFRNICLTNGLNCNPYNLTNGCADIDLTDMTLTLYQDDISFIPALEFINEFTIIFIGYIHGPLVNDQNVILGPSGHTGNCIVQYIPGNILEIDAFTDIGTEIGPYGYIKDVQNIGYQKRLLMPYDVTKMHTLEIYYHNASFTISQNYQIVETFSAEYGGQFGQLGGWFGAKFLTHITIHDIIFTTDSNRAKMTEWLKNYIKENNVKIMNETHVSPN